jgi:parvulin-like peptidyl-prolyl isomerase
MNRTFLLLVLGAAVAAANPESDVTLDGYAAVVNERVITVGEVKALVQPVERQLREAFAGDALLSKLKDAYEDARLALIERALILTEFANQKMTIPETAVDDRTAELIREQFNNDRAAFLAELAEEQTTLEEWRQQVREQIIIRMLRAREVTSQVSISPSDVRAAYERRLDEYQVPEKAQIRMIVLNRGETEADQKAKAAQAASVRERLEAGEDFAALARSVSEGSKAARGGDWGWIEPGLLRPELAQALAGMAPGETSPVIETEDAFYILRLEGRQPAFQKSFGEVQDDLSDELRRKETERLYKAWIARLKNKYYVQVF